MILLDAGTAGDRAPEYERVLEEIVAKAKKYRAAAEEGKPLSLQYRATD
jgi:hypothetical protein